MRGLFKSRCTQTLWKIHGRKATSQTRVVNPSQNIFSLQSSGSSCLGQLAKQNTQNNLHGSAWLLLSVPREVQTFLVGRQKQPRSGLIIPPCNHKLINTRPCWITGGGEGIHPCRCALMKRNNLKATRWSARGVRRRGRLRCSSTSSREGSPRQSWPLVKNHYVPPSLRELLPNSD